MSKPKRRTMRRLKRTLGITALILALLIAMIPDFGEAAQKNNGTLLYDIVVEPSAQIVDHTACNGQAGTLEADVDGFSATVDTSKQLSNEYRIKVSSFSTGNEEVPAWFYNTGHKYEYNFDVYNMDGVTYQQWLDLHTVSNVGPTDADIEAEKNSLYNISINGSYDYTVTFTFKDYCTDSTSYYPSVYYRYNDGGVLKWKFAELSAGQSGGASLSTGAGYKDLQFQAKLAGVDCSAAVIVYINHLPSTGTSDWSVYENLHIQDTDPHYLTDTGDPLSKIFFANQNPGGEPYRAESMRMLGTLSTGNGLKGMYLPGRETYIRTDRTPYTGITTARQLGIEEYGTNVKGPGGTGGYYGDQKVNLIDVFDTSIVDGSGNVLDAAGGKYGLNDHEMWIAIPLDGSGFTGSNTFSSYQPINKSADAIRILYKLEDDADGWWYDYQGPMYNGNSYTAWNGNFVAVNFTFKPNVSKVAVLIDRAGAVCQVTDTRGDAYQTIVDSYVPRRTDDADWDRNYYVTVQDIPEGDEFNGHVNDTGLKNDDVWHYNNDAWAHDVEVIRVTTSVNPYTDQAYSDATFPEYNLTLGLHDAVSWNYTSAVYAIYHKNKTTHAWEKMTGLSKVTETNPNSVKMAVNDGYEELYVVYYERLKNEGSAGTLEDAIDKRDSGRKADNGWMPNNEGVDATYKGTITGTDSAYLVVTDQAEDSSLLKMYYSSELDSRISGFTDGKAYYNIFIGRPDSTAPTGYADISKQITISNKIKIELSLPSKWTVTSTDNVKLVRVHDNGDGTRTVNWDYDKTLIAENRIGFEASEFSEYAVFYHEGDSPEYTGRLTVDVTNCFLIEENYDTEATSTDPLDTKSWRLTLTDPGRNDATVQLMERKIAESVATNDGTIYYPFYSKLEESTDGTVWYEKDDIGGDTITVYVPIPEKSGYATAKSFSVTVWGYNASNTRVQNMKASAVFSHNGTKYITFRIDNDALRNLNPYALVYTPSGDSPSPGPSPEPTPSGDEFEFDTYDPADEEESAALPAGTTPAVDLSALGRDKWKATTTIPIEENMELKLLVSQYSDPNNTQLGQLIIKENGITAYENGKSSLRVYDLKLKKTINAGKSSERVSWPSTPTDLGKKTVTITLPYQANLSNPNGTVSVWSVDKSGSLENLLAATTATTGGVATFTVKHFSQYAILYNPGTASPSGGSTSSSSASSTASGSASSSASTGSSSGNSGTSASNTGATIRSGASTNASTGTGAGGGGYNRASGDGRVDMPRTADATTYKAIFILILLAFGAFELISSLPAKKKVQAKKQQ